MVDLCQLVLNELFSFFPLILSGPYAFTVSCKLDQNATQPSGEIEYCCSDSVSEFLAICFSAEARLESDPSIEKVLLQRCTFLYKSSTN